MKTLPDDGAATDTSMLQAIGELLPQALSLVRFAKGSIIYRAGDSSTSAYLVESGSVRLVCDVNGIEKTVSKNGAGSLFGELCLVPGAQRFATAEALEDTELLVINPAEIEREILGSPLLVRLLVRVLLERCSLLSSIVGVDGATLGQASEVPMTSVHDTLQLTAVHGLRRERRLREALGRREFELYYQPIVNLRTRNLVGLEALVRWNQPDEGVVNPDDFIGIAERTGLIVPIGTWLMEDACYFAKRLHSRLLAIDSEATLPFVSVNVSPAQLEAADSVSRLLSAMRASGVDCKRIKVEITENVLVENPTASAQSLERLRSTGASVAVDDFGTGYASLSVLPRYPIDTLKIDRSFVMDIDNDGTRQVVRSMVTLARSLGMDTVAEGVETVHEMSVLAELGVDSGQGYLFAHPAPAAKVLEAAIRAAGR